MSVFQNPPPVGGRDIYKYRFAQRGWVGAARGLFDSLGWILRFGRQGRYMWTVPDILLTLFGVVLMVTPLALWVAWTTAIFTGVLVAALLSLIGAVIITRRQG
jgi:hypothetical protein